MMVFSAIAQAGSRAVTTSDLVVIACVIAGTAFVTRLIRPGIRKLLTWLARRSVLGVGRRWRVRAPRVFGETIEQAELRRQQRITATAAGLSRVIGALLWVAVAGIILHRAEIDATLAVSGAGFLGAAMAFGGQHSVNDFLTGMHILLEDRFGEGDQLQIKIGDEDTMARVAFLGAFSTRLEATDATIYIPNRDMAIVINFSQRGSPSELPFEPSTEVPAVGTKAAIEATVRKRYVHSDGFDGSHDGLIVDGVAQEDEAFVVKMRTARPLSDVQRDALIHGSGQPD